MKKELFINIIKDNNLEITNSNILLFVHKITEKISAKGFKYKLIFAESSDLQCKNYYYFNFQNQFSDFTNSFIFCNVIPFGNNFKITNIFQVIQPPEEIFKCKKCLWYNQSVCKNCENNYYFQQKENEQMIEYKNLKTQSFVQVDFKNEEELVAVNDYFQVDVESKEFWEKNNQPNKKEA